MYNSYEIAERIKFLVKIKKTTVKQVLLECGLAKGTIDNMKKSFISVESIAKIADILDCSIDYLMGRTDVIEINKKD